MANKPIFKIDEHADGQRLDNFLRKQRKQVATGQLYKLIRKGQVRINGKRCQPAVKLKAGDLVRVPPFIYFEETDHLPAIPADLSAKILNAVLAEDDDYLVVDKPAGLPVHKGTGHDYGVIEILQQDQQYRHILLAHRLDVVTSGCLVLAKNRPALLTFQNLLKSRAVKKTYIALLEGVLENPVTVDQKLQESRINGLKTAVIDSGDKTAITHIQPESIQSGITKALCSPVTGRTHQIRAHTAYLNCPIVGDRQYGASHRAHLERSVYLHARQIAFGDYFFEAPEPAPFQRLLLR